MKISVIGGGNIGMLIAAESAQKGHDVWIYTSKSKQFNEKIEVYDDEDKFLFCAQLTKVTSDLESAIRGADIIWVTYPANLFEKISNAMLPYVTENQKIGIVPGSGGAEYYFAPLIEKGCILFGLQRVHSIARVKQPGKSVCMLGRKDSISIASIPEYCCDDIVYTLQNIFDMPVNKLKNYLTITLTPSNPILHTTRIYSMFRDYSEGKYYSENFLFYENWTDDASDILIKCDSELQQLCSVIPMDLSDVKSLLVHYESSDAVSLTRKIRSIKAFKGLKSPMKQEEFGWVPDFDSRYFKADFSFGLKVIKDIAQLYGVKTPNIDIVWQWYVEVAKPENYFELDISKAQFINI